MGKKEYVAANRDWLARKALEPGVEAIGDGVLCKVLKSGALEGVSPTLNSVVTAHYVGRTIDGRVFDSSLGHRIGGNFDSNHDNNSDGNLAGSSGGVAPAFRLRDLIPGWITALRQMRPGDKWEVYIPTEMGYGKFSKPGIPGGSTLIFEIELLSVM